MPVGFGLLGKNAIPMAASCVSARLSNNSRRLDPRSRGINGLGRLCL
jgi:hypothetical protein